LRPQIGEHGRCEIPVHGPCVSGRVSAHRWSPGGLGGIASGMIGLPAPQLDRPSTSMSSLIQTVLYVPVAVGPLSTSLLGKPSHIRCVVGTAGVPQTAGSGMVIHGRRCAGRTPRIGRMVRVVPPLARQRFVRLYVFRLTFDTLYAGGRRVCLGVILYRRVRWPPARLDAVVSDAGCRLTSLQAVERGQSRHPLTRWSGWRTWRYAPRPSPNRASPSLHEKRNRN
jgi:hypothetical protein